MTEHRSSLLAGRNRAPLTPDQIRRASTTFLGLDNTVNVRYEEATRTVFCIMRSESGEEYGEIVFGPDIYPGSSVIDPNSALSLRAAVAHELTHYHRWKNMMSLSEDSQEYLDEALTSLEAIHRYKRHLDDTDVQQLISDAMQRLQLYISTLTG